MTKPIIVVTIPCNLYRCAQNPKDITSFIHGKCTILYSFHTSSCKLLYVIQVKRFVIKCFNFLALLDIRVFGHL